MAEIAKWHGRKFVVSPTLIRSIEGLSITGGSVTTDKTSSKQGYVSFKNAKADEISCKAVFSALTGCRVRDEAMLLLSDARSGATDYFYVGGKKLLPCKLMLTDASIGEIRMTAKGEWVSCDVQMTLKQAGKYSSSGSSSSSSSASTKKASAKKTSTKTTKKTTSSAASAPARNMQNTKTAKSALAKYQAQQTSLKAMAKEAAAKNAASSSKLTMTFVTRNDVSVE